MNKIPKVTSPLTKLKRELDAWRTSEIKKAVAEADRGDFATEHQVRCTMNKWGG